MTERMPSDSTDPVSGVSEDEFKVADAGSQVVSGSSKTTTKRLSTFSKMYDIDGDGQLDEAELAMRDMDGSRRGYLTNEKVYKMMQEQLKTQRQLFRTRRIMFVLLALVVILALANLGTGFAAASLAKDTTVSSNEEITHKTNGETLSTQTADETIELERAVTGEDGRRRLCTSKNRDGELDDCDTGSFFSLGKRQCNQMIKKCRRGNSVSLMYKWAGNGDETRFQACPFVGGRLRNYHLSKLTNKNGKTLEFEQDEDGNCRISGDEVRQEEGSICEADSDCNAGLGCYTILEVVEECKRRCSYKRWSPDRVQSCQDNCDHPVCSSNAADTRE